MCNDLPLRSMNAQSKAGPGAGRPADPRDSKARPRVEPPRWTYWRLAKSAPPWKLAALSLDLEPASIDPADPGSFPDAAAFGRFTLIVEAIERRFGDRGHRLVSVAEFVRWADSISLGLPPQLRVLGGPQPQGRTRA